MPSTYKLRLPAAASVRVKGFPVADQRVVATPGRASVPVFLYWLGTMDPERGADAERGGWPLPSLHSDLYAPVPGPSTKTGVLTMSLAALNLLGK
jgi:hypothetical protein